MGRAVKETGGGAWEGMGVQRGISAGEYIWSLESAGSVRVERLPRADGAER